MRDGLVRTPERMERSMEFLTQGVWAERSPEVLHGAMFDVDYDEMVIVKRRGVLLAVRAPPAAVLSVKAHIAYVPQGRVIGLSKLPRVVDVFARRLQVQERMTRQIADAIDGGDSRRRGWAVILEAQHLCMMMRGVEKQQLA